MYMIKKEIVVIESTNMIAFDTMEMQLQNKHISETAQPGQFIHILIPGFTLRRPISIAQVDRENNRITIIFKVLGKGTAKLAEFMAGEQLDVLGPNGNSFPLPHVDKSETILLIGGGVGVPPLHFLGKELSKKNVNVISVLGFQTAKHVFYENEFNQFGETYITTNDGTYGEQGFVTNVLEQIGSFDQYYTCGPLPMLKAVTTTLAGKEGFISLEERMGCGVGACFACVIPSNDEAGYKKICQDGPVFKAQEVIL